MGQYFCGNLAADVSGSKTKARDGEENMRTVPGFAPVATIESLSPELQCLATIRGLEIPAIVVAEPYRFSVEIGVTNGNAFQTFTSLNAFKDIVEFCRLRHFSFFYRIKSLVTLNVDGKDCQVETLSLPCLLEEVYWVDAYVLSRQQIESHVLPMPTDWNGPPNWEVSTCEAILRRQGAVHSYVVSGVGAIGTEDVCGKVNLLSLETLQVLTVNLPSIDNADRIRERDAVEEILKIL